MESGALRKLNDEYFKRIEAIEYSVKYDDGKHFTDIGEADALIVGVSRTSKTPLSMYLANKGYKIANIPLVPEVSIPDNVYQQKGLKVFGLTASPNYIANIRRNRAETQVYRLSLPIIAWNVLRKNCLMQKKFLRN